VCSAAQVERKTRTVAARISSLKPLASHQLQGDCSSNDPYFDYDGTLRCLMEGAGEEAPAMSDCLTGWTLALGRSNGTVHSHFHSPRFRSHNHPPRPLNVCRCGLHQAHHRAGGAHRRQRARPLGNQEEGAAALAWLSGGLIAVCCMLA